MHMVTACPIILAWSLNCTSLCPRWEVCWHEGIFHYRCCCYCCCHRLFLYINDVVNKSVRHNNKIHLLIFHEEMKCKSNKCCDRSMEVFMMEVWLPALLSKYDQTNDVFIRKLRCQKKKKRSIDTNLCSRLFNNKLCSIIPIIPIARAKKIIKQTNNSAVIPNKSIRILYEIETLLLNKLFTCSCSAVIVVVVVVVIVSGSRTSSRTSSTSS